MLLYFFGALCIIWGLSECFIWRDRYAKWWFNQSGNDYKDYDLKKFRLIRLICMSILGVFSILFERFDLTNGWLLLLISLVIGSNYCIFHFCKKKKQLMTYGF